MLKLKAQIKLDFMTLLGISFKDIIHGYVIRLMLGTMFKFFRNVLRADL
jgi:hypothetical protein